MAEGLHGACLRLVFRLAAACLLPVVVSAQTPVSAPRADGRVTPLLAYNAAGAAACAPLAVISHGAGGSAADRGARHKRRTGGAV